MTFQGEDFQATVSSDTLRHGVLRQAVAEKPIIGTELGIKKVTGEELLLLVWIIRKFRVGEIYDVLGHIARLNIRRPIWPSVQIIELGNQICILCSVFGTERILDDFRRGILLELALPQRP